MGAGATETPPGARDIGGPQVVLRILKILKLRDWNQINHIGWGFRSNLSKFFTIFNFM